MADDNPSAFSSERSVVVEAARSGGDKKSDQVDSSPLTSPVRRSSTPGSSYKERRSNNKEGGQRSNRGGGGSSTTGGVGSTGGKSKRSANLSSATEGNSASTDISGGGGGTGSKTGPQAQAGAGSNKKNNKGKYAVKKRAPPKEDFEIRPNDVFVNEKSHFVAQLSKCKKLFEKGHREVYLHGLGKAIPRAVNIAFELKKFYQNTVDYTVNTSTIQVYDDVIDQEDLEQSPLPSVRARNVSSVDIKVYRSVNIP